MRLLSKSQITVVKDWEWRKYRFINERHMISNNSG